MRRPPHGPMTGPIHMPKRVLVVDDEIDLAKTCARLLRRLGYEVICASTVAEGVRRIDDEALVAVVVDLRLPDGSGIDVVFAAGQRRVPTPAIVITGFLSPASREAALAAGARAILTKPFSARALADTVSALASPSASTT